MKQDIRPDKFKTNEFAKKYKATLQGRRSAHDKALSEKIGKLLKPNKSVI